MALTAGGVPPPRLPQQEVYTIYSILTTKCRPDPLPRKQPSAVTGTRYTRYKTEMIDELDFGIRYTAGTDPRQTRKGSEMPSTPQELVDQFLPGRIFVDPRRPAETAAQFLNWLAGQASKPAVLSREAMRQQIWNFLDGPAVRRNSQAGQRCGVPVL